MNDVVTQEADSAGGIGEIRTGGAAGYRIAPELAALGQAGNIAAESVAALRTYIMAQHMRGGRRSLAVCAPSEGVGCSLVATAMAVSMAQAGVKTLLIDANLRQPGVSEYIRPVSEVPGLLHLLTDETIALGDVIRSDVLPNLSVLYAGGQSSQPQELLAGREFKEIVDICMRDFDITIVDTPPANICADSQSIGTVVRYAMLVVRRNTSFVSDLKLLAGELQANGVKVIGMFLNDF